MVEVTAREKIYRVIFGTDTAAGQRFDIVLIYMIVLSVLAIIFDSIESVHNQFGVWPISIWSGCLRYFFRWSIYCVFIRRRNV